MSTNEFRSKAIACFSHPIVGIIGTLVGVGGFIFGIWAFVKQIPSRDMVAVEPSIRSVLVDRNVPAVLQVEVKGTPIKDQDVFSVQLALWNKGNQSIRPEHILSPIKFTPSAGTRVVDATVLRQTRSVCGTSVSVSDDDASATVKWTILEPNDGAIVQIVLVGDSKSQIDLSGVIEGGDAIRYLRYSPGANTPPEPKWDLDLSFGNWVSLLLVLLLVTVLGSQVLFVAVPHCWAQRRARYGWPRVVAAALFGTTCALIALLLLGVGTAALMLEEDVPSGLIRGVQSSR
jgi:hypothetical protein